MECYRCQIWCQIEDLEISKLNDFSTNHWEILITNFIFPNNCKNMYEDKIQRYSSPFGEYNMINLSGKWTNKNGVDGDYVVILHIENFIFISGIGVKP